MKNKEIIRVSLDEVTESYEKGLLDQLRGFGVEGELFETWVPDPDPTNSILNLVEAAITAGISSELVVEVSSTLMKSISQDRLLDELEGIAKVGIDILETSQIVRLTSFENSVRAEDDAVRMPQPFARSARLSAEPVTPMRQFDSPTQAGLRTTGLERKKNSLYDLRFGGEFDHQMVLEEQQGFQTLTVEQDGKVFEVQVDPELHLIIEAAFHGCWERDTAALLDRLCDLVIGRPIQDMSDHAVGQLEYSVRGSAPRPVPGIVLPSAVDSRFVVIQSFTRRMLEKYRESTGYRSTSNTFFDSPGKWWCSLSRDEQAQNVKEVIGNEAERLGLKPSQVELAEIEYGVRVLIRFIGDIEQQLVDKQPIMMQIEHALNRRLDPRLELFLEPLMDQSKLRRLGGEEE